MVVDGISAVVVGNSTICGMKRYIASNITHKGYYIYRLTSQRTAAVTKRDKEGSKGRQWLAKRDYGDLHGRNLDYNPPTDAYFISAFNTLEPNASNPQETA